MFENNEMKRLLSSAALAALAFTSTPALAQSASATSDDASPSADDDMIVVTARRREENIQSVPVAVSAFNETFIENRGIRDSTDISRAVPSLYIDQGGFSSSSSNIAMRGITNPGSNISFDPSIGIYIDEVYLARNYGSLFDYFDVSSIQALRGVQGTLFGRNNIGGALLIGTTKPQNSNTAEVEVSYGNYNAAKVSVIVNVAPVPDLLALRLGFQTHKRDGWGRNVVNGQELSTKDAQTLRASVLLTPSPSSEFQLTYERSWRDQSGPIFSPRAPSGRTVRPGLGFYEVAYDSPVGDKGVDQYVSGRAKLDLGGTELKFIANWLRGDETVEQDVDGTDSGTNIHFIRRTLHEQKSAELQISGTLLGERLKYVLGGYYLDETGFQPTTNVGFRTQTRLWIDNSTYAAYGHVDMNLTDALQIGAGLRYTQDSKGVQYGSGNLATGACTIAPAIRLPNVYDAASCRVNVEKNSNYLSWDINGSYAIADDINLYARVGRGQKSGGFNSGLTNLGDLGGYRPEIATDYEVGLKTQFLDRRVRLNLAAYQTNYNDVQRTALTLVGTPPAQSTVITVTNAARARIKGFEVEFSARPVDGLTFNANYSHTDPKYLEFTSGGIDQRNFPFAYVSRHQFGSDVSYQFEAGAGTLLMAANYAYRSRYDAATSPDPLLVQPGYGIWGGQIRFTPSSLPRLDLTAWVSNLSDARWVTHGATGTGIRFVGPGTPRLYGLTLRYRMGDSE